METKIKSVQVPVTPDTVLRRPQILKADDTFPVADPHGACGVLRTSPEWLFHKDSRYLSRLAARGDNRT